MRLTTVILIASLMQVSASGLAQRITLNQRNASLETILKEIRKQTSYDFFYDRDKIQNSGQIDITVKNATVNETLDKIFSDLPFTYTIDGKLVSIKPKKPSFLDRVITAFDNIDVRGRVVDKEGNALANATVKIKGTSRTVVANTKGEFEFRNVDENAVLVISFIGFKELEIKAAKNLGDITLESISGDLEEVAVVANTGYQTIPKVTSTGSFDVIGKDLLNRSVSTDILSRIKNLTPGILFDDSSVGNLTDPLLIRGRSTIYSNTAPLIVVDNFPYDGDLKNINPNDIENVTILKDAAAASIWGARSGNGVIVITTKKGKGGKTKVEYNSNVNLQKKPQIEKQKVISSADYIELEKFLFSKGFYNNIPNSPYNDPLTPVVELLFAKSNGTITATEADAKIEAMKNYDFRDQEKKYAMQTGIEQQHALNVSGGSQIHNYYLSAGYDRNRTTALSSDFNRFSVRANNRFKIFHNLEAEAGLSFIQSNNKRGKTSLGVGGGRAIYPYARLVDENGVHQQINTLLRDSFIVAKQNAGFLNWGYVPLDEIDKEEHSSKIRDVILNTGLTYKIIPSLNLELKYQYQSQMSSQKDYYKEDSFYARNQINRYTQINISNGELSYPIPKGGALDSYSYETTAHQGRAQFVFNKRINNFHQLNALAGWDIRSKIDVGNANKYYGYNEDIAAITPVIDYITEFQISHRPSYERIPAGGYISKQTDHFLSYFANFSYSYKDRYNITGSIKKEQANLFGVATNQKGSPFYSIGASWILSNESFISSTWIDLLKIRGTYGVNGNVSRLATAYSTVKLSPSIYIPSTRGIIQNPPNENLRWEKVNTMNIGFDFSMLHERLSGNIEYYKKNSKDLMASVPVDPTYGLSNFYGNVASMKGSGLDVQVNTKNINGGFKWFTSFLYSTSRTKVTEFNMPVNALGYLYFTPAAYNINPVVGRPIFALYSFKWNGLNTSGNPIGDLGGVESTDYSSIFTGTKLDSTEYNGSVTPTHFGAIRNTFNWRNFSLSINISYKFGHYFRRQSVNYESLIKGWTGHSDYEKRWQNPGDENSTNIPAFIYPNDAARDIFYEYSSVLIEKADHIRLEDVNLSYDISKLQWSQIPFKNLRVFLYASNLGILWTANKNKIDPYFSGNGEIPSGKRFALGLNITF